MKVPSKLTLKSETSSVVSEYTSERFFPTETNSPTDSQFGLSRPLSLQGSQFFPPNYNQPTHNAFQTQHPMSVFNYQIPINGYGYVNPNFLMNSGSSNTVVTKAVSFAQFKTIECKAKTYHDHKQCPFHHNLKDRRRCPFTHRYSPEMCKFAADDKGCPNYETCKYSHNTVEQFYHPCKYKTKLCASLVASAKDKPAKCLYGSFCSFAHDESELKILRLHKMEKTPDFFRLFYKTVYCPFNQVHDKSSCEYAHNVQDYRRDPKLINYRAEICKKWNVSSEITRYEDGGCSLNEACDRCHGWKELEYHPKFYKLKNCVNGDKCPRVDCGYLHPRDSVM
jgi:hypothetical protein